MKPIKDKLDTQPARRHVPCPFLALRGNLGFPEDVYLIRDLKSNLYALVELPDHHITGLACFSSTLSARNFARGKRWDLAITLVSFDEAREIAQSKKELAAIMLADDENDLVIHYVC